MYILLNRRHMTMTTMTFIFYGAMVDKWKGKPKVVSGMDRQEIQTTLSTRHKRIGHTMVITGVPSNIKY